MFQPKDVLHDCICKTQRKMDRPNSFGLHKRWCLWQGFMHNVVAGMRKDTRSVSSSEIIYSIRCSHLDHNVKRIAAANSKTVFPCSCMHTTIRLALTGGISRGCLCQFSVKHHNIIFITLTIPLPAIY